MSNLFKINVYLIFMVTLLFSKSNIDHRTIFLQQQEQEWIDNLQRPIRVGIAEIPNQVLRTQKGYEGVSIELFTQLESLLGVQFEYIYYETWDELVVAGRRREVDIIFSVQKRENELLRNIMIGSLLLLFSVLLWMIMLRRDNQKLQEVLDSSIASMAIFKNGKCILVNKMLLAKSGYNAKEVLGKQMKEFVYPTDHKELKERLKTSQDEYEITLKRKNGTMYPALVRGTNLNGNRRISSFIDISEIKEAHHELESFNVTLEEKIKEAINKNKKQEQMLSQQARLAQMGEAINMIAHQWRQPLQNINGLVMLIEIKLSKKDSQLTLLVNKELDEIESFTAYMSHSIDDFRDFFKPEKSKVQFNLQKTMETTLKLIEPTLLCDEIKVSNHYGDEIIFFGYPNELGQVIINMVNNARDALLSSNQDREKQITTYLFQEENRAVITIEDNAGGIDSEIIEYIFDPYFSTKLKKNGTGLGLYISKLIIEEHMGGELTVKNSDSGALFRIEFELVEDLTKG